MAISMISVDDLFVDETNGNAVFTVRLDVANTTTVTVNYATSNGTATSGSDFTGVNGTLSFLAGELTKTVSVPIINDANLESLQNFFLRLTGPSANATVADEWGMASIIDNDAASGTPVVSINDFVIDEAGKEAVFVITLDRPSTSVVTMNYATQNGTATGGSDFVAASGSLVFAPGETAKTVKVTLINDTTAESSEAFNLVLSSLSNATTLDGTGTAIIFENDASAVTNSNIYVDDLVVDESQNYADFIVRLDKPNTGTVTVNYSTSNGTATGGSDFNTSSDTLTFAAGETEKTVRITLLNDANLESLQNFFLRLTGPSANATIADEWGMASIVDNDAASGTPVVSINDFVIDEAGKEAVFVITLDRPSTSVVTMNYATQNGTATGGSDFVAASGSLVFAPGETAKTVKVTLINDTTAESSEAFNLVLSSLSNATTLDGTGTAIIFENDASAVTNSNIYVDDLVVDESQNYADFIVRLDKPNTGTVTVNYSTSNGTATGGSDFNTSSDTLTFAAGETEKTVRITLLNDANLESLQNFFLRLTGPSANATVADEWGMASIIDNDAASGTPVVSINDFVIDEAGKEAVFVITLDRPSTSVVTMNYATQNGTATGGSDFVAASGSLVFAPGETAKTVKVTLINDTAAESSEAFNLVLSSLSNATTLDGTGTAIIFENDASAVTNSNIYVDDLVVDESQNYADFIVRLDKPNTGTVTVNYSTSNGTATGGSDFNTSSDTLTFAAGETEKTVRITLLNDANLESLQNFFLRLTGPSANATVADEWGMASIIDNDAASGTPIASITDAVIDESAQTVSVTVILDKPSTGNVTLNVGSQNVTAVDGSDYRSFPFGKVAFAPGEVAKTVVFGILNDTAAEGFESFDVVLSSPVGATIGDAISHVVIANSDAAPSALPSITVADAVASETKGTVDFLVSLSAPSASQVTVNYSTSNGTATSGGDFSSASDTLVFAPGEITKSVRITLIDDIVAETTLENFTLNLNGAVNATIVTATASATIIDNESAAPAAPIAINGTVGHDVLKGTEFADSLTGNNGDDWLDGGFG